MDDEVNGLIICSRGELSLAKDFGRKHSTLYNPLTSLRSGWRGGTFDDLQLGSSKSKADHA